MESLRAEKEASFREYRKRLRERFKSGLCGAFDNQELLELLLTYGLPKKDIKPIARALAQRFGGLRGVFDASVEDLKAAGIGQAACVLIKLVKELAGVYLKERIMGSDVISSPGDLLDYLNMTLSGERVEKFLAIYMNSKNEVLAVETLHEGTINQTVVYPRKAIEKAFRHKAASVIFVHNHPSGDATPSSMDRQLAKVLDRAAFAVDLMVQDHLIIGRNKYFSARESGWISGTPLRPVTS